MSVDPLSETERNFEAFRGELPRLAESFSGKFALLHSQAVEDFFDSPGAAVLEGMRRFGRGRFSVQEVTDSVESLGFYSYAGGNLQA